jgi:hypothetical protein
MTYLTLPQGWRWMYTDEIASFEESYHPTCEKIVGGMTDGTHSYYAVAARGEGRLQINVCSFINGKPFVWESTPLRRWALLLERAVHMLEVTLADIDEALDRCVPHWRMGPDLDGCVRLGAVHRLALDYFSTFSAYDSVDIMVLRAGCRYYNNHQRWPA